MSLTIFPSKFNTTQLFLEFNYLSLLAPSETITGASITASVLVGTDPNPQAVVAGSPTITGPIVAQLIIGGLVGVIYLLNCVISTNQGNSILLQGHLAVTDSNPFQS